MDTDMKKCPICNGEANIKPGSCEGFVIQCQSCGLKTPSHLSRFSVIDQWNTRPRHHTSSKLVESLAKAAWHVLNHDNDFNSGKPDDTYNWEQLKQSIAKELNA